MQPKLKDSPLFRDMEVREGDPLVINLAPRKALVKTWSFAFFSQKISAVNEKKVDVQDA